VAPAFSLLGFVPIKPIERKQDAADLAPKPCLIAAQAIERATGQIGKPEKAAGELDCRIIRPVYAVHRMYLVSRGCLCVVVAQISGAEYRMDYF